MYSSVASVFVCQQDISKTYGWIEIKFGGCVVYVTQTN